MWKHWEPFWFDWELKIKIKKKYQSKNSNLVETLACKSCRPIMQKFFIFHKFIYDSNTRLTLVEPFKEPLERKSKGMREKKFRECSLDVISFSRVGEIRIFLAQSESPIYRKSLANNIFAYLIYYDIISCTKSYINSIRYPNIYLTKIFIDLIFNYIKIFLFNVSKYIY